MQTPLLRASLFLLALPTDDLTASGGFSYEADVLFGQEARFNGTAAYLQIDGGGTVVDDDPLSDTTISVWFKADRAPTGGERFFIYETAPNFTLSLGLRAGTAGNTRIQLFTDSPTDADPNISVEVPNAVVAGQWIHVATTISSTPLKTNPISTTPLLQNIVPRKKTSRNQPA